MMSCDRQASWHSSGVTLPGRRTSPAVGRVHGRLPESSAGLESCLAEADCQRVGRSIELACSDLDGIGD